MKSSSARYKQGIYVSSDHLLAEGLHSSPRNKTFAAVFLRARKSSSYTDLRDELTELWKTYRSLQRGQVGGRHGYPVPSGNLSVLMGYGPRIFTLRGINKRIPNDFRDMQFLPARKGGPILKRSGIRYGGLRPANHGLDDHVMVQLTSDSQTATYRAVVETWKQICRTKVLFLTKFYTGFQRDDGRSWLGFYDEVSNMKSVAERMRTILIDRKNNNLFPEDFWTQNGTYLIFLRVSVDISCWETIDRRTQELVVGRKKISGHPLIGVDKKGNPLPQIRSISDRKLKLDWDQLRDHPDYFRKPSTSLREGSSIDAKTSIKVLNQSHIGRTRHIHEIDAKFPASRRIFRQGFEFIESSDINTKGVPVVGLNFVSFQNDPARLFFILTDPHWMGNTNFGGSFKYPCLDKLLSVLAAGVFFVPPTERPFPGNRIFA